MLAASEKGIGSILTGLVGVTVLAQLIMTPLYLWLPRSGMDRVVVKRDHFYHRFHIAADFGMREKPPKKVEKKAVYQLSEMKLIGLYRSNELSFVTIDDHGKSVILQTGEQYKGYRLVMVKTDEAIFEKAGHRYRLALEKPKQPDGKAIRYQEQTLYQEDGAVFIKKREVNQYAKNLRRVWQNIGIQEVIRNHRLQGFKVTWVKRGSIFEKLGLRKGDLIIGANNRRFQAYSDVYDIYKNINRIDSLKLTIIRNNEEKELEYELF
jgi:general secretion pathway protein C